MTADELKALKKGNFIVTKTEANPMKSRLKLFLDWGITFDTQYQTKDRAYRKVGYTDKMELEQSILEERIKGYKSKAKETKKTTKTIKLRS